MAVTCKEYVVSFQIKRNKIISKHYENQTNGSRTTRKEYFVVVYTNKFSIFVKESENKLTLVTEILVYLNDVIYSIFPVGPFPF